MTTPREAEVKALDRTLAAVLAARETRVESKAANQTTNGERG